MAMAFYDLKELGEMFRAARLEAGLTQVKMGEELGVTGSSICLTEKGKYFPRKIAGRLGMQVRVIRATSGKRLSKEERVILSPRGEKMRIGKSKRMTLIKLPGGMRKGRKSSLAYLFG